MQSAVKKLLVTMSVLTLLSSTALFIPSAQTALAQEPANGKIAFTTTRDGNAEIYLMDENGGNLENITNNPASDSAPAWSPDGTKIAFVSDRGGNHDIYIMDADGENIVQVTTAPQVDYEPAWSPDGTRLVFQRDIGRQEIFAINVDGTAEAQLTNTPGYDNFQAVWSPDGTQILFTSRRGAGNTADLWLMNADGSNQVGLTDTPSHDSDGCWTWDGAYIVFVSTRDGNYEIYRMDANGDNVTNLTNNPATDKMPFWSAQGDQIAFVSERTGDDEVFTMDFNGNNQTNIANNASASDVFPNWQWLPGGCAANTPATAYQYDAFTLTLDCTGVTENVFGFQAGHTITAGDTLVTAQATTYTAGTIFQGQSVLTGENELDTYALSLQAGGTEATGDFTLGTVDYRTDFPGDVTFDLINLILGNIDGEALADVQATPSSATITIIDVVDTLNGVVDPEGHALDTELDFALEGDPTIGPIDTVYNPDGTTSFTIHDIHGHPAYLNVDAPSHLTCQESLPFSGDETDFTLSDTLILRAGDVNDDEAIDITDATAIGQQYGQAASGELDINNDGTVNILDLIHVGRNYGEIGETDCSP